ncbi:hypothetical protein MKZ38_004281 [Zalerion maritima]|uniref:NACHT domain-containing protein n=1 Tax=Zalerion maritima TaxID=339359 RepID=A0AAD5RLJ2_9PEZI|nr:hypothetical protein MKZ38_004281 [Zalerion maritima]
MNDRFNPVPVANEGTLERVFDHSGDSQPSAFPVWLLKGNGIFYFAGKLCSGKSTMMKFLLTHDRTSHELQKWVETRSKGLVMARYVFWARSLDVLRRTILNSEGALASEHIYTNHRPAGPACSPQHHISNLFYDRYSFCLFVDGLDEQIEDDQRYDYQDLIPKAREATRPKRTA